MWPMKRGEVWWVDFEPSIRGEIRKTRPALVVSNDAANRNLNRVHVVPLSSKTDKLYPSEAYVSVGSQSSKAMADQIATVSKQRLRSKLGALLLKIWPRSNASFDFSLDFNDLRRHWLGFRKLASFRKIACQAFFASTLRALAATVK